MKPTEAQREKAREIADWLLDGAIAAKDSDSPMALVDFTAAVQTRIAAALAAERAAGMEEASKVVEARVINDTVSQNAATLDRAKALDLTNDPPEW